MSARYDAVDFPYLNRVSFNDNINGTTENGTVVAGTPSFADDHPFITGGKSLTGASTIIFNNNQLTTNGYSIWVKSPGTPGPAVFLEAGNFFTTNETGNFDTPHVRFNFSTTTTMNVTFYSGFGNQTSRTAPVLANQWNHISFTTLNNDRSAQTILGIFVNGVLTVVYSNPSISGRIDGNLRITSSASIRLSELARHSSPPSIQTLGRLYAAIIPDKTARQAILTDNPPAFFYGLDIPSKAEPIMTNLGTEPNTDMELSFDADLGLAINVNQPGADDKGWTFTGSSTSIHNRTNPQGTAANTSNIYTKLKQVITNTAGFSFEFWYKVPPLPVNTAQSAFTFFGMQSGNSQAVNLPIDIRLRNITSTAAAGAGIGSISVDMPYPSGTTWLAGNETPGNTTTGLIRYDDDLWHHCVVTYSKVPNTASNTVTVYIDGILNSTRNYSTINWSTHTPAFNPNPLTSFTIGHSGAASTTRPPSLDSFIAYGRVLSATEVRDHYFSWLNEPGVTGAVRYWDGTSWVNSSAQKVWNGTAWIDWDHRYWNGTAWISL
jgi:hypothetical protein